MKKEVFILDKGIAYKLFMLMAFSILALVMYQGHIQSSGIYSILFFGSLGLCAFQIASFVYVFLIKRRIEINIDETNIFWKIFDNKKLHTQESVKLNDIKEVKTEINYLTGNIYSNFTVTFILNDESEITLSDGLLFDFGLSKAENVCKFLLENNLGDKQDVKFAKLVKELELNLSKEQKFTKKEEKSYYIGIISKNKKEFLSLRIQIENLYNDYKIIKKNANNEYLVQSQNQKNSYIYLRSNAIGYLVEYYNIQKKEELKTLKEMGKRNKIGF